MFLIPVSRHSLLCMYPPEKLSFFPLQSELCLLIADLIDHEGPAWCKGDLCCVFTELFTE